MALTTRDIQKFMKKNLYFGGVGPIDRLPTTLIAKPRSFIINLDESWKPGSHWVAIYFPINGPAYYFDSFGRYPPTQIINFMERNSKFGWIFNYHKLQGDLSTLCGYYCIVFIKFAPNYNAFYEKFSECNNDRLLKKFI